MESFTKPENVKNVLTKIVNKIFDVTMIKIQPDDEILFKVFNNVSSAVYNFEKNNSEMTLENFNNIVEKEVVTYVIENYEDIFSIKSKPKKVSYIQETLVLNETNNFVNIDNVSDLTVKSVFMFNEDYIINESNNKLYFKLNNKTHNLELTVGNYNASNFLEALNNISTDYLRFSLNKINNKITMKCLQNYELFFLEESRNMINNILGYADLFSFTDEIESVNPIKLIKKTSVYINVHINYTCAESEELGIKTVVFPLFLSKIEQSYNVNKKITKKMNIKEINIEFIDYNHRGFPFSVALDVTQEILT